MSNQKHAEIMLLQFGAAQGQEGRNTPHTTGAASHWVLICGLMLCLSGLAACSDNPPSRENSEMTVDAPPTATAGTPSTRAADDAPAEQPTGLLPAAGRKYQVIVETAYFFDRPVQATPSGRYLRRGDTFYGQGESNGFVKAGFVQPNGTSGTAWLKAQGLRKLPAGPVGHTAKTTLTGPAMRPPAASSEATSETNTTAGAATTGQAATTSALRAIVEADRAYFYNAPDLGQPRKAFCQRGDKVRVLESSGDAVRVTFTNWEKVTTTGWMRRDALRFSR